jgi:hypothetical protein
VRKSSRIEEDDEEDYDDSSEDGHHGVSIAPGSPAEDIARGVDYVKEQVPRVKEKLVAGVETAGDVINGLIYLGKKTAKAGKTAVTIKQSVDKYKDRLEKGESVLKLLEEVWD